ncbi:MAG: sulfate adenylyltransferase subunit CysN [Pseudomonadota bacterium]|nr:sulfate adenylyltransferase subunit CysN [Pseudomonadota bacterium]
MARLRIVEKAAPDSRAVEKLLAAENAKGLLRFLTCGSVDDGKSTLIGRLLYDSQKVCEDQMSALVADSRRLGTTGGDLDLALLVDGLQAEREQGITIDVAYRYFSSPKRKFIVTDTPGHEQYTRNMATGASTSDFAVLLVDARKGVLTQTRRHSCILSLLGIRKVVLAVNKMDLVGFAKDQFEKVADDYRAFAENLEFEDIKCIPIVARDGDNVLAPSARMHWYHGPTLMGHLETVDVGERAAERPLRFPVQWVNRPDGNFRGYAGTVASGSVSAGDEVTVLPAGISARIARIVTADGDAGSAGPGEAVTLTLESEVDAGRGDVIVRPNELAEVSDQISAHVIWMAREPLLPGRVYLIKSGHQTTTATVSSLKHKVNVENLDHVAGKTLELNEVGYCNLSLGKALVFDSYKANRNTGSFVLIDRATNATVAAGMIEFGLRRATNIHWQALDIDKSARSGLKGQKPCVLWFTGLSGSGKSTIASLLEKTLHARGRHTYVLDGDNVRHGLNRDLGFTDADRVENIRRVSETARLFVDAGLIVIVSFISPFRSERRMARELFGEGEFIEVFVDTPLDICEQRDPKGLYRKARAGQIRNFTGIDSAYEVPESPEVTLDAGGRAAQDLVAGLVEEMERRGLI